MHIGKWVGNIYCSKLQRLLLQTPESQLIPTQDSAHVLEKDMFKEKNNKNRTLCKFVNFYLN